MASKEVMKAAKYPYKLDQILLAGRRYPGKCGYCLCHFCAAVEKQQCINCSIGSDFTCDGQEYVRECFAYVPQLDKIQDAIRIWTQGKEAFDKKEFSHLFQNLKNP